MSDPLRDAILRHVNDPNYRAVKPKVIARQLRLKGVRLKGVRLKGVRLKGVELEGDDLSQVKKTIKRLVKAGELAYGPSHLICSVVAKGSTKGHPTASLGQASKPLTRSSKHVVGTFRRTAKGFGFVRPEGTLASAGRDEDIFVAANKSGDAAHGDIVRVRLSDRPDRMGRTEGRVIDVVERATNTFVGTYFEQGGMGLVQIDGNLFTNPIYVGDPGAKGARDDDKVVLEMVRFPSHVRDGEGVLAEILGGRGQPGIDTLSIIHEFSLPGPFPEEVHEEARRQATLFDETPPPPAMTGVISPPRPSSRSTHGRPATSTTPFHSSDWKVGTGGWGSTLPMCLISSSGGAHSTRKRWIGRLASTCLIESSPCCPR